MSGVLLVAAVVLALRRHTIVVKRRFAPTKTCTCQRGVRAGLNDAHEALRACRLFEPSSIASA
jgi:hypothetical protein